MHASDNYVGFDEVGHGFYRFYIDKDDDKQTIVFVKFMGQTHNMGIIDLEKISTIALVNRVMHMVLQRKLSFEEHMVLQRKLRFEEEFKLTLTQPWDNNCTNIHSLCRLSGVCKNFDYCPVPAITSLVVELYNTTIYVFSIWDTMGAR
ncbi:hypothetical protein AB3S75_026452 [Citrus x aurantiifolia]